MCVLQDDAGVDYAAMRKSAGFSEYSALAKELGDENLDLGSMSEIGARVVHNFVLDLLSMKLNAVTDLPAYSDTVYSDSPLSVTLLACPK